MKKKLVIMGLVLAMALSLAGCGDKENPEPKQEAKIAVEIKSEKLQKYVDVLDFVAATYIAELQNTGGKTIKISDISVDVEDAKGNLIKSADYLSVLPRVIKPGESAYICEEVIGSSDKDITIEDIDKAILHYVIEESQETDVPEVELSEIQLKENSYGITYFMGRAKNVGKTDLTDLYIGADIRNPNGELQNYVFATIESLPAGETKGFEQAIIYGDPKTDYTKSTANALAFLREF